MMPIKLIENLIYQELSNSQDNNSQKLAKTLFLQMFLNLLNMPHSGNFTHFFVICLFMLTFRLLPWIP